MNRPQGWLVFAFQAAATAGLAAWILRDPAFRASVGGLLARAEAGWLAAALGSAGISAALTLVRWGIFLRIVGIGLPVWQVARIGAAGLFFSTFLPGSVGGDAAKAGWLAARGFSLKDALLSAVMDRLSGLGGLVVWSALFLGLRARWLMADPVGMVLLQGVGTFVTCALAGVAGSFFLAARGMVDRLPGWVPGRDGLREFAATYRLFVERPRASALAVGVSLGVLAGYFGAFYFCALAVGAPIPAADLFALMPAVDMLAALPLSVGGFGMREASFELIAGALCGLASDQAVALSFAGGLAWAFWGFAGLVMLPFGGTKVR